MISPKGEGAVSVLENQSRPRKMQKITAWEGTVPGIADLLKQKNVSELRALAGECALKGTGRMRKDALVACVAQALTSREHLETFLMGLEQREWRFFQQAAMRPYDYAKQSAEEIYPVFQRTGYLQVCRDGKKLVGAVPAEVQRTYRELVEAGFPARKDRADLVLAYAMAAVNLYGVIPIEELTAIFNSQNGKRLSEGELRENLLRTQECGAVFWREYLVCDAFADNGFKDVPDLLARIEGKPRYIPPKAKLLNYADPDYYEPTPYADMIRRYLLEDAGLDGEAAQEVMSELHYAMLLESSTPRLLDLLYEFGITIPEDTLQIIADLLDGMAGSTRLWANNGYTPDEMFARYKRTQLKKMPAKAVKIGRNASCPCGSGKKYKMCCGR